MIKKFFFIIFTIFLLLSPVLAKAEESKINLYFFWSQSCPHCAREKEFIEKIKPVYPDLVVHSYEVGSAENVQLLQKIGATLGIETRGVPITIVGSSHFIGYLDDETTGKILTGLIEEVKKNGDPDPVGKIINPEIETVKTPLPSSVEPLPSDSPDNNTNKGENVVNVPEEMKVPLIGNINLKNLSLPLLTIILAAMDGFNPCAMWTLLFLISLLLGMKDRKRMFILGSAFILSSAVVYFLFLSAWLNLFLFIGLVTWVRIAVGLLAFGAGGYYLYDFIKNKNASCKVTGNSKRQKIFEKIRNITQKKEFLFALGGIIILAFAVNLVELVCSAGLPAIYTQVLSMADLPRFKYYGYLILYVLIFMLDDLFIFFTAMITLQATGIQSKYSRFSHLVGGILMLAIGILLLLKPEILMFG